MQKASNLIRFSPSSRLKKENMNNFSYEKETSVFISGIDTSPIRQTYPKVSILTILLTYVNYIVMIIFGHFRDFIRYFNFLKNKNFARDTARNITAKIIPISNDFSSFFVRNIFICAHECFNRPISTTPGVEINILERRREDLFSNQLELTGKEFTLLNFGSYNYLGFASNKGPCANDSKLGVFRFGISQSSTSCEYGTTFLHKNLEKLLSQFLFKEDSIIFGMGFITNAGNISALFGKGSLILSDELNHASIVLGAKLSGATIRPFKHNDMKDLEIKLRKEIIDGYTRLHHPWKKIVVIVEGIYSMEGSIINLPTILELKRKYKFYLWLDEAHSIGAMGISGRGIVEYWGCNFDDIDILMGTFSKSFGAHGGYISGKKNLIDIIRRTSQCNYAGSMSCGVVMQIFSSLSIIMNRNPSLPDEGIRRIQKLSSNTRYFRQELYKRGFCVYGADDSPIVPIMLYYPAICIILSSLFAKLGFAIVVVGFPATTLTENRFRFCISASHTREMLESCINAIDILGDSFGFKYCKRKVITPIPYHYPSRLRHN